LAVGLPALVLSSARSAPSMQSTASRIVTYVFEAQPQERAQKLYNWEVHLSEADSKKGLYEIVQVSRPTTPGASIAAPVTQVLFESKLILPGQDGAINFRLHAGDKVLKQNMGRSGYSGQAISFSGSGTGVGSSNWIVLPGSSVEHTTPVGAGTPMVDGNLPLIRFEVINARGEHFQTDVLLRRK